MKLVYYFNLLVPDADIPFKICNTKVASLKQVSEVYLLHHKTSSFWQILYS